MERKLLVGITGESYLDFKDKKEEIEKRKIRTVALFLSRFSTDIRKEIYSSLEESSIDKIPLVHLRHDMAKEELEFLKKRYDTTLFTIHEEHFDILSRWEEHSDNLFLEMSTDDAVAENVKVERVGGFCVDLAHYQKQKDKKTVDYKYVHERRDEKHLFRCNHVGGYCKKELEDLHRVSSIKDFDYLKDLPDFIFGRTMAMEIDNSIEDQLKFGNLISEMLPYEIKVEQ